MAYFVRHGACTDSVVHFGQTLVGHFSIVNDWSFEFNPVVSVHRLQIVKNSSWYR